MKKLIIIMSLCLLVALAGCGKKADPIDLPDNDAVKSIDISSIDGDKIELSEDGMKEILHIVRDAEPTRSQSINDQPTNLDAYGTIVINTNEESTVLYYYEKNGKYYVEQPYVGIYRLDFNPEAIMPPPVKEE